MPVEGEYEPSPEAWVRNQVALYEGSGGTEGLELQGKPVVILTSLGAKSGKVRKNPLMRVEHEGTYAVVASQGGLPKHPTWYFNLVAHPQAELQDGPQRWDVTAREITGDEKALWWTRATDVWPAFDEYQKKTDRQIPIFLLER
jgi:deazaflavin-dependent oxidoreductase (nitroreductase family)